MFRADGGSCVRMVDAGAYVLVVYKSCADVSGLKISERKEILSEAELFHYRKQRK